MLLDAADDDAGAETGGLGTVELAVAAGEDCCNQGGGGSAARW